MADGRRRGQTAAMPANLPRIEHEVTVMFYDTDCAAVVHNLAYLRFIEEARTIMAEKMGMPLRQMVETGLYPVVLRTEIDYRSPGKVSCRACASGSSSRSSAPKTARPSSPAASRSPSSACQGPRRNACRKRGSANTNRRAGRVDRAVPAHTSDRKSRWGHRDPPGDLIPKRSQFLKHLRAASGPPLRGP